MLHRYIEVAPQGPWGFTIACKKLFQVAGITEEDLRKIKADPIWFEVPKEYDCDQIKVHSL